MKSWCDNLTSSDTGRRRPTGCLIVIGHFSQKSPVNSGSLAKNDLQLKASYGFSLPCIKIWQLGKFWCNCLTTWQVLKSWFDNLTRCNLSSSTCCPTTIVGPCVFPREIFPRKTCSVQNMFHRLSVTLSSCTICREHILTRRIGSRFSVTFASSKHHLVRNSWLIHGESRNTLNVFPQTEHVSNRVSFFVFSVTFFETPLWEHNPPQKIFPKKICSVQNVFP